MGFTATINKPDIFVKDRKLSDKLFDLLHEVLNDVHDVAFSNRFYRILLEDHVRAVISCKKELKSGNLRASPDLFSLRISFIKSKRTKLELLGKRYIKHFLLKQNLSERTKIIDNHDHLTVGFSRYPDFISHEDYGELTSYAPLLHGSGDKEKREKLKTISENITDPLLRNSIRLLPQFFIEHFQYVYNQIELIEPKKKTFHVLALRFHVYDSILFAKYIENGSQLIWYQTGAESAEFLYQYSRYHQYSISDEYRTWGWKMGDRDIPWIGYPLIKFKNNYQNYNEEKKYRFMLCYPKITSDNSAFYKECTEKLLHRIQPDKNNQVLIRPYPSANGKSSAAQFDYIKQNHVKVGTSINPIAEDIASSKTVVQMVIPSTNFLECISIGKPSLGLLLNAHPTELIKPYYIYLTDKNVLHRDIESLANQMNSPDIHKWWSDLLQDEKMKEFRRTFTNC